MKESMVATCVMQSNSNQIEHSVAVSIKGKQMSTFNSYMLNSLASIGIAGGCDVMLSSLHHVGQVSISV